MDPPGLLLWKLPKIMKIISPTHFPIVYTYSAEGARGGGTAQGTGGTEERKQKAQEGEEREEARVRA